MGFSRRNIIILGLVSALSIGGFLLLSRNYYVTGFPLDDAWIHQTYARNLASGNGWSFFPGEPSAGLTAPLWALLLSIGHLLGIGPYPVTFILGWLALWGLSLSGVWGWKRLNKKRGMWALGAGLLLAGEWHLIWAAASGMETLLFSLLMLGGLIWLLKLGEENTALKEWFFLGGLIGLSVWIRPEGVTLLGPVAFVAFLSSNEWLGRIRKGFSALTGFILFFAPYRGFNRWLAGDWWPNTFYAKQAEYAVELLAPLWERLGEQYMLPLVGVGVVLLPGFVYLFFSAYKKKSWGVLAGWIWVVGHLSLYAVRLPVTYQHGRYVMPVMPVFFLWGFAGAAELMKFDYKKRIQWILSWVWAILIPMVGLSFLFNGGQAYARDVAFINSEMVVVGKWIANNTSEDDLIAAHDIGAIGYFGGRQILDLAGLVSPDVIAFIRDESQLSQYLIERNPMYLVTFPSWYPELVRDAELLYEPEGNFSQNPDGEHIGVYILSPKQ